MVRHNEKKSRAWQQNFAPKKWAFQSVKKVAVLNEVFIQSPALACRNHFWRSIVKPRPFVFFPSSDLYSKSMSFFSSANSQYFFMKILGIGSWVSWINSCKGHWCGSTYMVVRLSDVRGNFFVFLSLFWAYVEQHDNHIGCEIFFFLLSFPQNKRKIY